MRSAGDNVNDPVRVSEEVVKKMFKAGNLTAFERRSLLHHLSITSIVPNMKVKSELNVIASRLSLAQSWTALDDYNKEKRTFESSLTSLERERGTTFKTPVDKYEY